jgi:hypothetical protein
MKAVRRVLMLLTLAGIAAWVARLRGRGGVPPSGGGWRELRGPDYR